MSQKFYVGNLSFKLTEEELSKHFSQFGNVISAKVVTDRETGRARGFGFVEMDDDNTAISSGNGTSLNGRSIIVSQARDRQR